jgi:hypothetical protein
MYPAGPGTNKYIDSALKRQNLFLVKVANLSYENMVIFGNIKKVFMYFKSELDVVIQ